MRNLKITFVDPVGLNYDGNSLNERGLGGSEASLIYMAESLAGIGFDPVVYNNVEAETDFINGVRYKPYASMEGQTTDILVVLRSAEPLLTSSKLPMTSLIGSSSLTVLWRHDISHPMDSKVEGLIKAGTLHEIFNLSDWHTMEFLKNTSYNLKKYIYQTRNGVRVFATDVMKDTNKFIFTSAAIKGMVPLVQHIWPQFKAVNPNAELVILGGYYKGIEDKNSVIVSKYKELDLLGITFKDVLPPHEVAQEVATSMFFVYPNNYQETFGISTLEALCYKTIPITVNYGALEETVPDKYSFKLNKPVDSEEAGQEFLALMQKAVNTPLETLVKMHEGQMDVIDCCRWQHVALEWKKHFYDFFNRELPEEEMQQYESTRALFRKVFNRVIDTESREPVPGFITEKKILLAVPRCNHISTGTFESLYSLDKPEEYETELKFFWAYLEDQGKNFAVDDAISDRFEKLFMIDRDSRVKPNTLKKFLGFDADIVFDAKNKILLANSKALRQLGYPQFYYDMTTKVPENEFFLKKVKEAGLTLHEVKS